MGLLGAPLRKIIEIRSDCGIARRITITASRDMSARVACCLLSIAKLFYCRSPTGGQILPGYLPGVV